MKLLIICMLVVACVSIMPASILGAKNTINRHKVNDEVPRALPLMSAGKRGDKHEAFARNKRASKKDGTEEDVVIKNGVSTSDGLSSHNAHKIGGSAGAGGVGGVAAGTAGASVAGGVGGGKRGKNKKNNKSPTEISSASSSSQHGGGIGSMSKRPSKGKTHTHQRQQRLKEKSLSKSRPQSAFTQNAKNTKKDTTKVLDSGKLSSACRYSKSSWTDCDAKSNTRKRTLTLKKGENSCEQTKTIERKCKKACRYDKGTWSDCANDQMTRTDTLKSTSDTTCKATRTINKNCNPGKAKDKKDRKKAARKGKA